MVCVVKFPYGGERKYVGKLRVLNQREEIKTIGRYRRRVFQR